MHGYYSRMLAKHRPLRSAPRPASVGAIRVASVFDNSVLRQPRSGLSASVIPRREENRQFEPAHNYHPIIGSHRHQQLRYYIKPKINFDATFTSDSRSTSEGDEENSCQNHPLDDYIHHCLSPSATGAIGANADNKQPQHQGFNVAFLGTSGGIPTRDRICSATVLRLEGHSLLFDASEGVQRQLMQTRISFQSVTRIFITHLHADHVLGLPGLLLALQLVSQNRKQVALHNNQGNNKGAPELLTVELYGPPGLYNYVAMSLALTVSAMAAGQIVVHELVGGHADPGSKQDSGKQNSNSRRKDVKHAYYREVERRNLKRKVIAPNADGTWTLVTPSSSGKTSAAKSNNVTVTAAEVQHVPGVMTFGYVVEEEEPQPKLDIEKAKAVGLKPGPKYRLLKAGQTVESDDGKHMVEPHQVMDDNESTKKARKFALIGDNCRLSPAMYRLCQDCDVLVHEATLVSTDEDGDGDSNADANMKEQMAFDRGHASPEMAGQVAKDVNAKVLVLNHISPKVKEEHLARVVQLTEQRATKSDGTASSAVVLAHDFMELVVPIKGFDDAVLVRK